VHLHTKIAKNLNTLRKSLIVPAKAQLIGPIAYFAIAKKHFPQMVIIL
tara:strand:- start:360 stop:503 length:144 start_codon:yes stop_codon:yes gene_type:complete